MGTYWENNGPHDDEYRRLHKELVPGQGKADTLQGECLRAASKLAHDYWNNGGGNNVSGAFFLLRKHLPDFKRRWSDALLPYVSGSGGIFCSNVQLRAVEEILDATVQYVLSKEGEYDENPVDWHYLNVRETGYEISQWDAEYQREELDKKKQGDVVPKYEIHNYRGPRP